MFRSLRSSLTVALAALLLSLAVTSAQEDAPIDTVVTPGLAANVEHEGPPGLRWQVIGESVQGRLIEAVTIGEGERAIVLVGGIHTGAEAPTADLVRDFAQHYMARQPAIPPNLRLIVVPMLNPDGYAAGTRTNANGVDLNRNWPTEDWASIAYAGDTIVSGGTAPLSEPETAALYNLLIANEAELVMIWHGYAGLVEANSEPLAEFLGPLFASIAGYEYIDKWTFYPITGQLIEAAGDVAIPAFDIELGFDPVTRFARNLAALEAVIEAVASDAMYRVSAAAIGPPVHLHED